MSLSINPPVSLSYTFSLHLSVPACYTRIHGLERKAAAHRLSVARSQMLAAESAETILQAKYGRFTRKVNDLQREMGNVL